MIGSLLIDNIDVFKILDENAQLISTIQEFQSKGKAQDCVQ